MILTSDDKACHACVQVVPNFYKIVSVTSENPDVTSLLIGVLKDIDSVHRAVYIMRGARLSPFYYLELSRSYQKDNSAVPRAKIKEQL